MADQITIDTYNVSARQYGDSRDKHFWEPQLSTFKKYLSSGRVLDIGCGTGRDTKHLIENGFTYIGIDASEAMLAYARQRNPNADYRLMDFEHLDFPPASFDGFWAAAALLHVHKEHIVQVLKGIAAVLKDDGVGFISVKPKKTIDEGYIEQTKWGGIRRFFSFYTPEELTDILAQSGFEALERGEVFEDEGTHWLTFFVQKHGKK